MNTQATPVLRQLQDLLQELRANAQGRPELEALCQNLDRRYLEVDEGLTRNVLRFDSATQTLMSLEWLTKISFTAEARRADAGST
ncbi:hypothetical protein [Chromobacterium haemolyticum]|uniref:hypothetical protein n=1 Tax=Chromobacterium haemolyticum TaxID=394935 RepID=UPI00244B4620|nr:hypothetical protein [Chromobacterium haemolyticum]MDH0342189.1 hypothetical protein [Chromobacterium haemolyticum]